MTWTKPVTVGGLFLRKEYVTIIGSDEVGFVICQRIARLSGKLARKMNKLLRELEQEEEYDPLKPLWRYPIFDTKYIRTETLVVIFKWASCKVDWSRVMDNFQRHNGPSKLTFPHFSKIFFKKVIDNKVHLLVEYMVAAMLLEMWPLVEMLAEWVEGMSNEHCKVTRDELVGTIQDAFFEQPQANGRMKLKDPTPWPDDIEEWAVDRSRQRAQTN